MLPNMGQQEIETQRLREKLEKEFKVAQGWRTKLNVPVLTTFKMILFIKVQTELELLPFYQRTKTHLLLLFYFPDNHNETKMWGLSLSSLFPKIK